MSNTARFTRTLAVLGLVLAGTAAYAHVGQTAPAKWMLRLEQKSQSGKPSTTKTYAWKVPLATFNKRYDDSVGSPLAQVITKGPAAKDAVAHPLWLTLPETQHAVCMRGATLEFISDTQAYLCDSTGALANSAGVPKNSNDGGWRNYLFGFSWYTGYRSQCVTVNVARDASCTTPSYGSDFWGWGLGYYVDGDGNYVTTPPTNSDTACSVTISGPGLGAQTLAVSGTWPGTVINLGDMWYYGKTPMANGKQFCQEGLQSQSCGGAGGPSKCGYFGIEDGISKGVNLPLDRESIVSASRKGMPLLKSEAYGWMRGAMQREQLMNGFFTHILTDVKLLNSMNNTQDISKWTSEDVEVQWTVYLDNTPADAADKPGRNTPASYGDVLIRRVVGNKNNVASGAMLLCRYQSHTSEFLPPLWAFPKTGYLTCSSWKPPSAAESAAGNTAGTILNPNIFDDPTNPDTVFGLNLGNAYDDRSNDDPTQCAVAPGQCIPPFEAGGGGDRLIKEVIIPLMSKYDAQGAALNYLGAPIFTLLNRQSYQTSSGMSYINTGVFPNGGPARMVNLVEPVDSEPAKLTAGQSFWIKGRSVNFPNCGTGSITMSQNWEWDAENAVPELNWDAYRVLINPMGSYQVLAEVNTGDGTVPSGNGLPRSSALNAKSTRSGIAIPFSMAITVPSAWRSTLDYYWNDKVYSTGELTSTDPLYPGPTVPASPTPWNRLFYPEVKFAVPPGPGKFDGPYFVLDPMEYPSVHPGYNTVYDAHLYDGRTPLNASTLSDSLNHTFRSAPQNGTVTGSILQTQRELICDTKGTSQCCTRWDTTVTPEVCKDGVCTGGETVVTCGEWSEPYDTCSSYHCEAYYCDWGSNEAQVGSFVLGSRNYSCGGWEYLEQLNAAYAANRCVLPYGYNHMRETVQYGNSLSGYMSWKEEAVRTNRGVPGVGSTAP